MKYIFILLAIAFTGCGVGAGSHTGHDHGNEGHDHAAEASGHDDHDHEAEEDGHGDRIVFTRAQAEAAGLTIETAAPGVFSPAIKTSGQIQNKQDEEAILAATSSGIVSFAGSALTEGAAVVKGQTLVTISAQNIVGDPAAQARIEYQAAEREYRRSEELIEDQIISERDFNEAKRRYETARAALPKGATGTGVRVASPLTGYVKSRSVGSGEYVSVGQPIATISKTGKLQLRAEVSERYFGALSTITGANFKTSYDRTLYHADKLLSYGRTAEGAYIPVLFEFADVGGAVPGAFVEVWLLSAPMPGVLSVPKSALTEEQGLYFVYLQHGQEDYVRQEVAIGADNGQRVQILKGINAGDKVVTHGAIQVRLAAMSGIVPEGHSHAH